MGINLIKIPISNTILTEFNTEENQGLFDVSNSLFLLRCNPDQVTHEAFKTKESHPGLTTTYVTTNFKSRVIAVETKECREAVSYVLESIQDNAEGLYFPILDYHHPEKNDRIQGYTERQVFLKNIQPIGGTFSHPTMKILGLGWRIEFEEDVRRFL